MESTKKQTTNGVAAQKGTNKDPKPEVSTANFKDMKAVAASKAQETGGWENADALFGFATTTQTNKQHKVRYWQ